MRLLQTTRMAALALATALLATACGGGTTTEDETTPAGGDTSAAAEGEAVSIGITQIVAHPSLDASAQGFKDALADAGYDVTYDEQNAQGDQSTAASIAGTFASADLDLILAIATPTAQSVVQAVTDVPILFTAVTDPVSADLVDSMEAPGGNATGTSDANPVMEQLELVKRLNPDATTVGIVYSSGEVELRGAGGLGEDRRRRSRARDRGGRGQHFRGGPAGRRVLDVDAFYVVTGTTPWCPRWSP